MATKTRSSKATKTNVLNVAFVLDMSGSMLRVLGETREGVNGYLRELATEEEKLVAKATKAKKKAGVFTRLSLTCFDTVVERWAVDQPILEVPIDNLVNRYQPRGYTALYDSVAQTIVDVETRLRDNEREDEKVLVVVMTDGLENASVEYNLHEGGRERILELIKSYEAKGNWTFVFLGNEQALSEAIAMGIAPGNTAIYDSTQGASVSYAAASLGSVTSTRRSARAGQTVTAFADAGAPTDYRNVEEDAS